MQPLKTQLIDLVLIQLTNWRWAWRGMIVAGLVLPLLGMLAFSAFAENRDLGYILTGNLVMSLLFSVTSRVSGNFVFMRVNGMLDFFLRHGYATSSAVRVGRLDLCLNCNKCQDACAARHGAGHLGGAL